MDEMVVYVIFLEHMHHIEIGLIYFIKRKIIET